MSTDGDGGALEAFAQIGVKLGEIHDSLKAMHRMQASWIQRASDSQRNHLSRASFVCPSNGILSMVIGEPRNGFINALRAVRVGGALATTIPTATGLFLIQSPSDPVNTTSVDLSSLVDNEPTVVLPAVSFYTQNQIILRYPDKLWVVLTGATSGTQYVANAEWEIYPDGGYGAQIEL